VNPKLDVNIYELIPKPGSRFRPSAPFPWPHGPSGHGGIFWLTDSLRADLRKKGHSSAVASAAVSPNHILIPARLENSCPHGPPYPVDGTWSLPAPATVNRQPVTIIDSGWQWDSGSWPGNPLVGFVNARQAERLPMSVEVPVGALGRWQKGVREAPGEQLKGRLLALAGHANFIAGVIASHCPEAKITVINHNGSFLENAARAAEVGANAGLDPGCFDYPTEAAVARSLCWSMSQNAIQANVPHPKVIDVGFAFLPWTTGVTVPGFVGTGDALSAIWQHTFAYMGSDPIVVAPSGNQDSELRRYPAALWARDPVFFKNVVGVASIDDPSPTDPRIPAAYLAEQAKLSTPPANDSFTNHGAAGDDWVRAAAIGRNVVSTFLYVNTELEDRDDLSVLDFEPNGWAVWNGTSFATPKVVAGIASQLAAGAADPSQAWTLVEASGGPVIDPELGVQLPGLG
jgi:hypothetical protein